MSFRQFYKLFFSPRYDRILYCERGITVDKKYTRLKFACYASNVTMGVVSCVPPLLFLTFRSMYSISFSLLGLLVLIGFVTQLSIDLVFSFFSHKFNIPKVVKTMPFVAVLGFVFYAVSPFIFKDFVYVGLIIGTIVFSAASGLAEVFISPIIAAIPSDDPEREMSRLHSVFAWGVVFIVIFATLFLLLFGSASWQFLVLVLGLIPLTAALLFLGSEIPEMQAQEKGSGVLHLFKNKWLWLSVLGIFLGGATECTMSQWNSTYLENALGIPKVWGDVFGVATFSMMLGLGRTLYTKIGKNISRVLFIGAIGATACYLVAALCDIPVISLFACAFTGLCVSMMWPGSLIIASERFPCGVFIFALMAAGGDLGASIGPQLVGVITDLIVTSEGAVTFADSVGLLPEQLGLKCGVLVGTLFPLSAIPIYYTLMKSRKE